MALDRIRNTSNNIFFKIFLVLIIVSFAIWGIGDIFRSKSNSVAKVDGVSITTQELYRAIEQEKDRITALTGSKPSEDTLKLYQVQKRALQSLIENKLLEIEANSLGIYVSDLVAGKEVINNPIFAGKDGKFDKEKFSNMLIYSNVSEANLLNIIAKETSVKYTVDIFSNFQMNNTNLRNNLIKYFSESVEYDLYNFKIRPDYVAKITDEEKNTYYETHKNHFKTKQERSFDYAIINLNNFKTEKEISKEEMDSVILEYKKNGVSQEEIDKNLGKIKKEILLSRAEARYSDFLSAIDEAIYNGQSYATLVENFFLNGASVNNAKEDIVFSDKLDKATQLEILSNVFSLSNVKEPKLVSLGKDLAVLFNVTAIKESKYMQYSEVADQITKILSKDDINKKVFSCAHDARIKLEKSEVVNENNECLMHISQGKVDRYKLYDDKQRFDAPGEILNALLENNAKYITNVEKTPEGAVFAISKIKSQGSSGHQDIEKLAKSYIDGYSSYQEFINYLYNKYSVEIDNDFSFSM